VNQKTEINQLFARANELWFGMECRLNEAFALYQEIFKKNAIGLSRLIKKTERKSFSFK